MKGLLLYCGLLLLFVSLALTATFSDVVEQRFDKKPMSAWSFRSPFYLVRGTIPFWDFGGAAVVTEDYLRITPDQKSTSGYVWGQKAVTFDDWEVVLDLSISGTLNVGADGMAFWYIDQAQPIMGNAFGGPDTWVGLGVFVDTFDNDARGDNPSISILVNDGTWKFTPDNDGYTRVLGTCKQFVRNTPFSIKIQHYEETVFIFVKITKNGQWTPCAQAHAALPMGYYFAVTAATGGLSDNHDVTGFTTSRLAPKGQAENLKDKVTRRPPYKKENEEPEAGKHQTILEKLSQAQKMDEIPKYDDLPNRETNQQPVRQQAKRIEGVGDDVGGEIKRLGEQYQSLSETIENVKEQLLGVQSREKKNSETFKRILDQQLLFAEALDQASNGVVSPSTVNERLETLNADVRDVRDVVDGKFNQKVSEINNLVSELQRTLNLVKGAAAAAKQDQELIHKDIQRQQQALTETVQSSGLGFWTYVLLIQIIGGFGYMYWLKNRDERNKKLY